MSDALASAAHPSLGDPGDLLEFVPLRPFADEGEESNSSGASSSITIKVPNADILTIFAHRQWRAGMLMADLIFANIVSLKECDVLELGAGTGLPSIAAHKYGQARRVVSTDYDSPSLINTLRSNVENNRDELDRTSSLLKKIIVAGHTWGQGIDDVQDLVPSGSFDMILLADCIWDSLSHASLLKSACSLLRKNSSRTSRIIIVSGLHTGRDKIVSFLRRAHRMGLELTAFPGSQEDSIWPGLASSEEEKAQREEQEKYASDEAVALASTYILEMQLLFNKDEEETAAQTSNGVRLWQAKSPRLGKTRRTFVVEERNEEKKENNGVHIRNRWITFLALKWKEQ